MENNKKLELDIIRSVDVAVVGGGVSGLSAAYRLHKAGHSVVVIEARDRVGGRTWSRDIGGMKIDVGGQWIGPAQTEVMQFCEEHGLETIPTYTTGRKLMDLYGKVRTYKGLIPKVSPWSLLVFGWSLLKIEFMLKKVPLGNPWQAKKAKKWDSMTVADWQRRNMPSQVARDLMTAAFKTIFGCDTADLSLLHAMAYAKSSGGIIPLIDAESEAGSQHLRLVAGAMAISEKMAELIGPGNVLYNSPVSAIRQTEDNAYITTATGVVAARKVVMATPLSIAAKMEFEPALPANKRQLLTRTPMADIVKVFLFYRDAFWRADGKSGEGVATSGPFSVVFDNVSADGVPCLLAFVGGDDARLWSEKPASERKALAIETMTRYFGPKAAEPTAYHEQNWAEETYSGGGPVGFFPTNTLASLGHTMRRPDGHLHWAGTETAIEFCGFIEGAKRAGYRAADEILKLIPAQVPVGAAK